MATEEDLPEILTIYNDIILHTTAVYDYKPHTMDMRKSWFASKQKDGYPVFVAEKEKAIIGFSSIGPFRAWAAYKYSIENSVYVATDQQGKKTSTQSLPASMPIMPPVSGCTNLLALRKSLILGRLALNSASGWT